MGINHAAGARRHLRFVTSTRIVTCVFNHITVRVLATRRGTATDGRRLTSYWELDLTWFVCSSNYVLRVLQ